jgi:thiamine-monophosphate kinase
MVGHLLAPLSELGELGVIRIMERLFGSSSRVAVGFGDDVSAVKLPAGKVAVLKTDMLVGSTDVPPGMTMRQAAMKAVVANVSDLAAKGVRPLAGLVALGLPPRLKRSDITEIGAGLRDSARKYGFPIVGGDTNESRDLTIAIALFAVADRHELVLRSGAKVGDLVAVTGDFGSAPAGLKALLERRKRPKQLPRSLYDAVFNPIAELETGVRLAVSGTISASIDSSDGLAWSLHQLSEASKVGMEIYDVPVSRAAAEFADRFGYDGNDLALYGGEEYHLVVTVKRGKFMAARRAARGNLKLIGVTTSKSRGVRLKQIGRERGIERRGWEHFKR